MSGYDEQFVVQGVHMIFDGYRGPVWTEETPRKSKLVFIGENLVRQDIVVGFDSCTIKTFFGDE